MVIMKAKRIRAEWCVGAPVGMLVRGSENEWINRELIIEWAEQFVSILQKDGIKQVMS